MTRPSVPDLCTALLRSMSEDVPSPHAKKRALVALGLAHSTVAIVSAATAAQAGTGTTGAGGAVSAASSATAATGSAITAAASATAAAGSAATVSGAALGTVSGAAVATAKVAAFAYGGVLAKPLLIGALAGAVTVGGRELSRLEERTTRAREPASISHVQASPTGVDEAFTPPRGNRKQAQVLHEAAPNVANSQPSPSAIAAAQLSPKDFVMAQPSRPELAPATRPRDPTADEIPEPNADSYRSELMDGVFKEASEKGTFPTPNSSSQMPRWQGIPSSSIHESAAGQAHPNEPRAAQNGFSNAAAAQAVPDEFAATQVRHPAALPAALSSGSGVAQHSSVRVSSRDLSLETRELAAVRALLAAGLASRAREALDQYDAAFSQGLLRPEAAVLRIELVAGNGDLPAARRLARAFELAYPQSTHLHKIRALVDSDTRAPTQ